MKDWGFDFVRVYLAYAYYLKFNRSKDITPEEIYVIDVQQVEKIELIVSLLQLIVIL
jgi:uncharacterized protein (DUF885 family)